MDKEKQKQAITEIMNEDAKDGLYKQQTAVEWLKQKLLLSPKPIYNSEIEKYFEEARQMEREQHKKTWLDSTKQFANDAMMDNPLFFIDYYTQTYGE